MKTVLTVILEGSLYVKLSKNKNMQINTIQYTVFTCNPSIAWNKSLKSRIKNQANLLKIGKSKTFTSQKLYST